MPVGIYDRKLASPNRGCFKKGCISLRKGKHHSKKTIEKMREAKLGKAIFPKGTKFTKKHRENLSKAIGKGEKNHCWKGGKRTTAQGYILILKPEHPFCNCDGCVLEHRLVMEKILKRYLTPKEIVHHKGTKYPMGSYKDRSDNRPKNLKLFPNKSKHQIFHKFKQN